MVLPFFTQAVRTILLFVSIAAAFSVVSPPSAYAQEPSPVSAHRVVGGPLDFAYTKTLSNFSAESDPAPSLSGGIVTFTNQGDGTARMEIDAGASAPQANFYGSPFAFEATAFPYVRLASRTSYGEDLVYSPSPGPEENASILTLASQSDFAEYAGRMMHLALTQSSVLDHQGLRLDPMPAGTGTLETLELDYLMVDAYPTLGLGEFNRSETAWVGENVTNLSLASLETLTGNGGEAAQTRSIRLTREIDNGLYNALEIRVMRQQGSTGMMAVRWQVEDSDWYKAEWRPESDGQFWSYMIDLTKCPEWREEASVQMALELFDDGASNAGKAFAVDFVRLRRLPELGGGIIHDFTNWGVNLNTRYNSQWDYVLSRIRAWRSVAGQASNNGWRSKTARCGKANNFEVVIDGRQPWWKDAIDYEGDGTVDYEFVARDGTGTPSVEAAAEKFFQEIKTISAALNDLDSAEHNRLYSIYPDNALQELIFPNPPADLSGGFYEVVGGNTTTWDPAYLPAAQEMAADCFVRMMEKLQADPETSHVKVFCFNALHVWWWNSYHREHSANVCDPGNLPEMIDILLEKNAEAFPNGDSPLVGFAQDFPWQYFKLANGQAKMLEYMDYIQSRGYLYTMTCNGEHRDVSDVRRQGYEAAWRYLRRVLGSGGRPDEVHAYYWQDYFDGQYQTTILDEHEDEDYTYTAALRRTLGQIDAGLPPDRPEVFSAIQRENGYEIKWDANQEYDIAGYTVQRSESYLGPYVTLSPTITATSWTDTTASTNTVCFYRVTAWDTDNLSGLPSKFIKVGSSEEIVLVDQNFDDLDQSGWFTQNQAPTIVADDDDDMDGVAPGRDYALKADYSSTGNGASWLYHFAPAGSPVVLNPGDRLEVQWQYKQTEIRDAVATYMRIGLANSNSLQISNHTAYENAMFNGYTGYIISFGDITDTTFPYAEGIFQRRYSADSTLSNLGAYTSLDATVDIMGILPDEWTTTQSIALNARENGWILETTLGGSVLSASSKTDGLTSIRSVVLPDAENSLDTFFMRYSIGESSVDYLIDNFKVTYTRFDNNASPIFLEDQVILPMARVDEPYEGQTLAELAIDPDPEETLTFNLLNGPAWLNLSEAGILSGTPAASDVGVWVWTAEVRDSRKETSQITLQMLVVEGPSEGSEVWRQYR